LQQYLDFLFSFFQRGLTVAREFDALFEFFHRLVQRQVAAFQFLDQLFELGE